MALINSFEKSGNFLFKYRGHLPLILFFIAIPIAFLTPYEWHSKNTFLAFLIHFFSAICIAIGHIIRILTIGRRFMQSSGRNRSHQVADQLNTTGIYSIVRHPLYLGNAFIWFGLVCLVENAWFVFLFILIYWVYYERIMFAEEQFLQRKFGNQFKIWSSKVPAFFPLFHNFTPSNQAFSWRIVIKNEYPGWISTLSTLLFLIILKRSVLIHELAFSIYDLYFLLIIVTLGVTFKGIKKFTNMFNPMD
jgi:protein-S-isoprenylcysteine O-methyltransferase Ste14